MKKIYKSIIILGIFILIGFCIGLIIYEIDTTSLRECLRQCSPPMCSCERGLYDKDLLWMLLSFAGWSLIPGLLFSGIYYLVKKD